MILTPFVITGLVVAGVAFVLGVVFIKDRWDKKQYFGKLLGIFSITFLLAFAIPALSVEFVNCAFDTSVGEKTQCVVIDKQTRYSGRSGPSYYLVLRADGREINFDVEKVIYFQYKTQSI